MIIQRETEEFRASKTHSALVDQSYQLTVNQDVKGVKNRALTHERNQQRSRLVLLSSVLPALSVNSWGDRNVSKQGSSNRKRPWTPP